MIMIRLFQDKSLMVKLNCLEGSAKDFNDFQSSLGFPIFSFSFPTTKVFFLSLIKYCTLLGAFL